MSLTTTTRRSVVGLALAGLTLSGGAALAPTAQASTAATKATPTQIQKIVDLANAELRNPAHNVEKGGYNCNFYTGALGRGSKNGCPSGWRSEAWCADFATYVWKKAGVNTSGLTAEAGSFATYGKRKGTWSGTPHVGDAIVYNLHGSDATHVGIVISVHGRTLQVISGNSGEGSKRVSQREIKTTNATISGYASPVR